MSHLALLRRSIWISCLLFAVGGVSQPVMAQDAEESEPAAEVDDTPAAPDQVVTVDQKAADYEIADRLRNILDATGWFESPDVRVDDGVAFLQGTTDRDDYRKWARELALKTEGVVAVVNKIKIEEGPLFDFEPAKREMRSLSRDVIQALPLFVIGLVVLVVTLLLARGIANLAMWLLAGRIDSAILRSVIQKTLMVLVIVIGVFIFLRLSGLTRVAMTLLGGTGVAGLIIGFAFRDIAENFLASLLISVQRPFRIGDLIEVSGFLGVVQRVTTRGTVLMDFDGNHIQISNAEIYKNTIKNYTANPNRRLTFAVGIGYDADIPLAQETVLRVLQDHSAVLDDPKPNVLVENLGAATVNLRVYYWINGETHSILKVNSAMMRLALRALESAGVSLPDEAREIIFPDAVPVQMLAEQAGSTAQREEEKPVIEDNSEYTAGEGDLSSEQDDIEKQSQASGLPEDGSNILDDAEKEPAAR